MNSIERQRPCAHLSSPHVGHAHQMPHEDWIGKISPELVVLTDPLSDAAKAVRSIYGQLQRQSIDRGVRSFAVIGLAPGDGASFLCANLAVCCAQTGRRTALVDANLSRPRLAQILGVDDNEPGLADWLRIPNTQDNRFGTTPLPNLLFISAGQDRSNRQLLQLPTAPAAMLELSRTFDMVFYDAPSATDVANALACAAGADRTILVGREHKTQLAILPQVQSLIEHCHGKVAGFVLTQF